MLELMQLVKREYLIPITSIKPFHSVWKLTATSQTYSLKKLKIVPGNFSRLAWIINEFRNLGFNALTPIITTDNGKLYIEFAGGFYSLSPWIAGEKPSFNNPLHLKLIARCFGKFHSISGIFPQGEFSFPAPPIYQQGLSEYQTNLDFLESILPKLPERSNLNRIDRAIINYSDYYLRQARTALGRLNELKSRYPLFDGLKGLCHNDPAPGNIIINNSQCYLIDFEFSSCDLFIKEFALLAQRALQATGWESSTLDILSAAYNQERPLKTEEMEMLPYLIYFPRRFWRLCHQRYREKLDWTEKRYQSRLWEIIEEEPKRYNFLQTRWPELGVSD